MRVYLKNMLRFPQERRARLLHYEELANTVTHGLGMLLSLVGMIVLINIATDSWRLTSFSIFGFTMVFLYAASTLYHAAYTARHERARQLWRVIDHIGIYLLIAGTYTPFALVTLNGVWGWALFSAIWGLALAGIIYKLFFLGRWPWLSTLTYVLMGWMAMVAIKPLLDNLPLAGFGWMIAGGITYSIGVLFFIWDRLPFNHTIWHLFVLGGTACHFVAVVMYV